LENKVNYITNGNIAEWTEDKFDTELEKGYQDCINGRVQPIDEAFAEIRKELNINP
jgi:hypothetical protein